MDIFEKFKTVEQLEALETITVEKDQVWPIIRIKVFEEFRKTSGVQSRVVKVGVKMLRVFYKTFLYGFRNFFLLKKADCWVFSASDRRKEFNGQFHDRIIEDVFDLVPNTVLIENPLPLGYHYNSSQIPNKEVVSQTFFYFWSFLLSQFIKPKINNEELLIRTLKEFSVDINYKRMYALYKGQYIFTKFLLKFFHPKKVIMIYTASSQGYIKAFKEKKIPVIEIQHGIINDKHIAYNLFKKFDPQYFPDYLFTFSDSEKMIFNSENYFIPCENVRAVGYSFLDKAILDIELPEIDRKKYLKVIAFSFQEPFGEFSVDFLKQCALKEEKTLFLLILRNPNYPLPNDLPDNLIVDPRFDIYKSLKLCDIHSTINSTTTLEAFTFGKPSILIDYKKQANAYFQNLTLSPGVRIVSSVEEFIAASNILLTVDSTSIKCEGDKFFKSNFKENLRLAFSELQI
nr:hypothetical protein [uncultured Sphingobacterium sp.]